MADTESNVYFNQTSNPPVKMDVGQFGGRVRAVITQQRNIVSTDFDASGDRILICQLPSNARMVGIRIVNADLGSGESDVDFGIYPAEGAVALDADCFAEGVTAFATAGSTEVFGTGAAPLALVGQALWDVVGLTEDPGVLYDIVATQTATVVTPLSGNVCFIVKYTVD